MKDSKLKVLLLKLTLILLSGLKESLMGLDFFLSVCYEENCFEDFLNVFLSIDLIL